MESESGSKERRQKRGRGRLGETERMRSKMAASPLSLRADTVADGILRTGILVWSVDVSVFDGQALQ